MPKSSHTRNGKVRKHVLRWSGMCVNGKHTGTPKPRRIRFKK